MKTIKLMGAAVWVAMLLGCLPNHAPGVTLLQPPTGEQTSLSRLTVGAAGKLHLSWVESRDKLSLLYHTSLSGDRWTEPKLINAGEDWFVNWADFPFLSVNQAGMTAHWLQKSHGGTYAYDVHASFYDAANHTWGESIIIHKDGVNAEHGFVSMLPMSGERTFISWLDGRNTGSAESHAGGHAPVGGMTLRGGIFDRHGETLNEWELDGLVCDCCQTSAAMTTAGPVVVYRDRTEDEIRDIYITRKLDSGWSTPMPVHADNWQIAGCPVNGPSVAANGNLVAVGWFSAKDDQPKVSLTLSHDGGETFDSPVLVAEESTNGRVSVAITTSGDIAISWLETRGNAAKLMLARYDQQGELQEFVTVAETRASRRSGFPVIVSHRNHVYVTWTDVTSEPRVRVARVNWSF